MLVARRASSAAAAATAPDHTVETTPTPGTATTTYNIVFITSEARPPNCRQRHAVPNTSGVVPVGLDTRLKFALRRGSLCSAGGTLE